VLARGGNGAGMGFMINCEYNSVFIVPNTSGTKAIEFEIGSTEYSILDILAWRIEIKKNGNASFSPLVVGIFDGIDPQGLMHASGIIETMDNFFSNTSEFEAFLRLASSGKKS